MAEGISSQVSETANYPWTPSTISQVNVRPNLQLVPVPWSEVPRQMNAVSPFTLPLSGCEVQGNRWQVLLTEQIRGRLARLTARVSAAFLRRGTVAVVETEINAGLHEDRQVVVPLWALAKFLKESSHALLVALKRENNQILVPRLVLAPPASSCIWAVADVGSLRGLTNGF